MNREDIICWARESAMVRKEGQWGVYYHEVGIPDLMRFAALVAAAEREACAMVCANMRFDNIEKDWSVGAALCAEAIRARGEK